MCYKSDYNPKTTFWRDFSNAEKHGKEDIRETFRRIFDRWKLDYVSLTELVLTMRWKMQFWAEKNRNLAGLYDELCEKADQYAIDTLKGEELDYFQRTID